MPKEDFKDILREFPHITEFEKNQELHLDLSKDEDMHLLTVT